MKQNIAIIIGGYSIESQISLKSGQVVYENLPNDKYNSYLVHIEKDKWFYKAADGEKYNINLSDFSLCLNDEIIYFDILNIPHTSCDMYQAAITFNKRDCLSILNSYNIPMAISYPLSKDEEFNPKEVINRVGLPCFVKANKAGSSFGVSKVYKLEELQKAIDNSFEFDNELIIESFIDGIEVSVGVLNYKNNIIVLPITEIIYENDFFDYDAKYNGKSQEITPARISKKQKENVKNIAKKIYTLLGMKGFSRSEFIFKGNVPYFLEMNTVPGLTRESILPKQAEHAGISLEELFTNAIEMALSKND